MITHSVRHRIASVNAGVAIITALLFLSPLSAMADDTTATSSPDPATTSGLSTPGSADASELGPATSTGAGSGGSNADGGSLQPAGNTPLQSTNSDSNGLTAPNSSTLQSPATASSGDLKVIINDADGPTHAADNGDLDWSWLWWVAGIVALAVLGVLGWRLWLRRQLRQPYELASVAAESEPEPEPKASPTDESAATFAGEPAARAAEAPARHRLSIIIKQPPAKVFQYVIDPKNTSTWVSSIAHEKTNEWPARVGTLYTNADADGQESTYKLTEFNRPHSFTLSQQGGAYRVRYILKPRGKRATKLDYEEWMDEGPLAAPFTQSELEKLKAVLENRRSSH